MTTSLVTPAIGLIVLALLAGGCMSQGGKHNPRVSTSVLDKVDPPSPPKPPAPNSEVPGTHIPAIDKLYWVGPYIDPSNPDVVHGDHVVFRREADATPILVSEPTRRLLAGNVQEGRLFFQPAIMDREMAEELARSRSQAAQTETAVQSLIAEATKLAEANQTLQKQTADLALALEQQVGYSRELEQRLKQTGEPAQPRSAVTPKAP